MKQRISVSNKLTPTSYPDFLHYSTPAQWDCTIQLTAYIRVAFFKRVERYDAAAIVW